MKIIITAGEAQDKGIWEKLCNLKGIDIYAIAEGTMDSDKEIILTEEEAHKLGLKW